MPRALAWSIALNVLFACAAAAWVVRRIAARRAALSAPSVQQMRTENLHDLAQGAAPADVVMVGDSLTQYGEWFELVGRPLLNRGIAGDTIPDVRRRLGDVAALRPKVLFLMIGINDLARGKATGEVIEELTALIRELRAASPSTRLVVQSILPVRGKASELARPIAETNAAISKVARDSGATWLDVGSRMADPSGVLAEPYSGDGLHLTGAGYRAWAEAIRPLLP